MSVVAVRDGVVASDSQCMESGRPMFHKKLHRKNGVIIGYVGQMLSGHQFLDWFLAGADRAKLPTFLQYRGNDDSPSFTALVLDGTGLAEWNEYFVPFEIVERFYAIGSGAPAAIAAMHMGADAEKAVEIACEMFADCGGEVLVERL